MFWTKFSAGFVSANNVSRETILRHIKLHAQIAAKRRQILDIDFTPFFQKYESLVYMADHLFGKIKKEYPECVTCKIECSDCCHALFDLSLIEAMYLNHHFNETFSGSKKEVLIEKANRADRKVYQLKRKAYKDFQKGTGEGAILEQMARERLRCPLDRKSVV